MHYFWHGKWKFYDKDSRLIRSAIYENGEEKEYL
jgi:antitoxin component YwqK of YwqJK toxin-antitoxin module